jgi:hypothetical protein
MSKHGWAKKLRACIPCPQSPREGDTGNPITIQLTMKQPTNQEDRNEDKKKPEKENPSHGIDPETDEPEMEVANP